MVNAYCVFGELQQGCDGVDSRYSPSRNHDILGSDHELAITPPKQLLHDNPMATQWQMLGAPQRHPEYTLDSALYKETLVTRGNL